LKVVVDRATCTGHARCWSIDPALFTVDEDGYSDVTEREVPPDSIHHARSAVSACPEGAISLVE